MPWKSNKRERNIIILNRWRKRSNKSQDLHDKTLKKVGIQREMPQYAKEYQHPPQKKNPQKKKITACIFLNGKN